MTDETRNPSDSPQDQGQPQGSTYSFTRDQLKAAGGTAQESVQPTAADSASATQPVWEPAATQPQPAWQPAATQPQPKAQYQVNPAAQQVQSSSYAYPTDGLDYTSAPGDGGNGGKRFGKKGNTPKDRTGLKNFALGFAGAAVACVIAFGGSAALNSGVVPGTTTVIGGSGAQITAQDTSKTLAEQVSSKCLPSVVSIDVYVKESSLNPYGGMFGMSGSSSQSSDSLTKASLGSGVVLSEDGYIVTNYHVIEGADALKVTIVSNEYDAEVVGSDESSDIAVIKAKGVSGLTPIDIGDSDNLTVGEWVMSIGSPFGLEQSVATGIVSATSRSQIMSAEDGSGGYTIYPNMIQTDAAINPGNSGGALVDAQGRLIGINTMITSYSGNYSGVGFAIPVNYAISLSQQIIEGKTPTHAQLGVTLSSIDQSTASRYGFAVSEGAYISSVSSGSGADKAGLEVGDIVTKLNDTKIASASDLMLAVRSQKVGAKVTVEFYRGNEVKTAEVTLGSDESTSSQKKEESQSGQQGQSQDQGYSREDMEELFNRFFGDGYGYGSQDQQG